MRVFGDGRFSTISSSGVLNGKCALIPKRRHSLIVRGAPHCPARVLASPSPLPAGSRAGWVAAPHRRHQGRLGELLEAAGAEGASSVVGHEYHVLACWFFLGCLCV